MSNSPTSDDALPSRPWLPWGGGAVLAAVMGLSLWYAWSYWYAAPTLPEIDLTTASPELVKVVKEAVADVRARPRSADAWGRLGMIMLGHGYYSEARVCFTEAARLDPQSARWLYLHARTSFRYQPRQAIALLERALVVDPDDAVCRLLLGELFLEEGRLDDAERVLVALLQDESMKPWGHLRLAQLSLRRGDVPRALEQAQRAQQRLEDSKAVHVLLSEIHFRLGDAKQAEAAQQTAQALRDRRAPDPHMEVVDRLRVDVLPLLAQAKDDIAALEDVVRA
ncbi:MAG: tetratricopeptide repeat protein, partial [Planctomycetes bacterium]|nr:tetratricopeptide repeat protein [Planctomycetota bacterium]